MMAQCRQRTRLKVDRKHAIAESAAQDPSLPRARLMRSIQTIPSTSGKASRGSGVPPGKAMAPTVANRMRLVVSRRIISATVLVICASGV